MHFYTDTLIVYFSEHTEKVGVFGLSLSDRIFSLLIPLIAVALSNLISYLYDRKKEVKKRREYSEFVISTLNNFAIGFDRQIQYFNDARQQDKSRKVTFLRLIQTVSMKSFMATPQDSIYKALITNKRGKSKAKDEALSTILNCVGTGIVIVEQNTEMTEFYNRTKIDYHESLRLRQNEFKEFIDYVDFEIKESNIYFDFYEKFRTILLSKQSSTVDKQDYEFIRNLHEELINIHREGYALIPDSRRLVRISQSVILALENINNLEIAMQEMRSQSKELLEKTREKLVNSLNFLEMFPNKWI